MTRLRELEKRLRDEPDNLGLKVQVAGAMVEAGRRGDALELYRAVAHAYRDQGRTQQALVVCRGMLELAPDDPRCRALLDELAPGDAVPEPIGAPAPEPDGAAPSRRSSTDLTPLPRPLPYHVADPTTRSLRKLSAPELRELDAARARPGSEDGTLPEIGGFGARASSASSLDDDLAAELDTRELPRIDPGQLAKISAPPPTVPVPRVSLDRDAAEDNDDNDDERTRPRALPDLHGQGEPRRRR